MNTARHGGAPDRGALWERASWLALLLAATLTPLVHGNLDLVGVPTSVWDPVSLPKLVFLALLVSFAGISLAIATIVGKRQLRTHWLVGVAVASLVWTTVVAALTTRGELAIFGRYMRNDGLLAAAIYVALFVLAIELVSGAARLMTLLRAVSVSGALVAAYALAQYLGVDPITWPVADFGDRVFATFGNPDLLGTYLVFPLLVTFGLALTERVTWRTVFFWSAAGVQSLAIVLSLVRGAWVGLIVGMLAFLIAAVRFHLHPRRVDIVAMLIIAVLVGGAVGFSHPQSGLTPVNRVVSALVNPETDTGSARVAIYRAGARAWLDRPFLGWGPGAFDEAFTSEAGADFYRVSGTSYIADDAHSHPLHLLVTTGAWGALLSLMVLFGALVVSVRCVFGSACSDTRIGIAAVWSALVGLLAALMFSVSMPAIVAMAWLAAGVLVSAQAHPVALPMRARHSLATAFAICCVIAGVFSAVWIHADHDFAVAMNSPVGRKYEVLSEAVRHNPLAQYYRIEMGRARSEELEAMLDANATGTAVEQQVEVVLGEWQRAVDHDPYDLESRLQYCEACILASELLPDRGYLARAVDEAVMAIELAPNDPETLVELAVALEHAGRLDDARKAALRSVAIAPTFVRGWLELGLVEEARHDRIAASNAYSRVLRLEPSNPDAIERLARLSNQGGDSPLNN